MKPIGYVSYINEIIALILFILTLMEVIANEIVMFYIIWVMGLFMSIFAGARDLGGGEKPKKPQEVFTPVVAYLLYGIGVFQFGILIASFFPQIGNYTLILIILFIAIGAKWGLVHGYKLYEKNK
jgi:hypothetical protein